MKQRRAHTARLECFLNARRHQKTFSPNPLCIMSLFQWTVCKTLQSASLCLVTSLQLLSKYAATMEQWRELGCKLKQRSRGSPTGSQPEKPPPARTHRSSQNIKLAIKTSTAAARAAHRICMQSALSVRIDAAEITISHTRQSDDEMNRNAVKKSWSCHVAVR